MKKLFLFLVIAGLLGAGAIQAQNSIPVKGRVDVQRIHERFFENAASAGLLNVKGINEAKGAKDISPDLIDTIGPTAMYNSNYTSRVFSACPFYYSDIIPGDGNRDFNNLDWINSITGGLVSWWGNGSEVGQKYSVSPEEGQEDGPYWNIAGINLKEYRVVGAVVYYARFKSRYWAAMGYQGDNIPSMPFRMKLYAGADVAEQQFFRQIIQPMINEDLNAARRNQLQKVTSTYPKSKKQYSGITDTLYAEFRALNAGDPGYSSNYSGYLYYGRTGGMFDNAATAATDFCITVELPVVGTSNGNAAFDSIWSFGVNAPYNSSAGVEIDEYDPNSIIASYNTKKNEWWMPADTSVGKAWLLPSGNPQIVNDPNDGMIFYPASSFTWFSDNFYYNSDQSANDVAADQAFPATTSSLLILPIIAEDVAVASEKINPSLLRVSVSPVPAIDKVNIACVDNMERVEILNIAGKVLKRVAVNDNIASVSVTDLPSGMYLVRVSTKDNSITKKVIVK